MNRQAGITSIEHTQEWEVLVIGGGATGLGVAVDASSRGYRTLLLEASDFAKGTSSRSTKLVHGGVRYLEQGDIPLVLEALRERGRMHANAPHLVHHQSFIVPRYKWWEGPFFGIGLKVYDALAGRLNLAPSRILSREETITRIPNIETENLLGGVEYFDGQFDDARLAVALARTATVHGATVLNYTPVTGMLKSGRMIRGVTFQDSETGKSYSAKARVVINAAGIFSDELRKMDDPAAVRAVQPSQGVHLVFDKSFLEGESAIMVPHTDDGRVLFVIPWHDHVLVGTTDTARETADLEPRALDEEIGFILRNAARYLSRDPEHQDILSVFAGQRPLVRPPGRSGTPTKSVSRNHEILVSRSGLVTIVGGKWTTYRKMAEDTMDQAITLAGLEPKPCVTKSLPIFGWWEKESAPNHPGLHIYGSEAVEIEALISKNPGLGECIHPGFPNTKAEVIWAARHEHARTLEDVLARRTRLLFLDARAAVEAAPIAAALLAVELKKDTVWEKSQVASFTELASGYMAQ
jgi:glycerol-3-phosphate dehydrogenase